MFKSIFLLLFSFNYSYAQDTSATLNNNQAVGQEEPASALAVEPEGRQISEPDEAFGQDEALDIQGLGEEGLDAVGREEVVDSQDAGLSEDQVLIEQIESLNQINEGKFILRPYIYNQRGRRDPFTPIISDRAVLRTRDEPKKDVVLPGLEKYRIDSFQLTSILWSVNEPKALVVDPEKKVHLITENSRIGTKNGYVVDIKEGSVIIVEEEKDEEGKSLFTTQVLKMGR